MLGVIGDLMVARTRAVGFALVGVSSTFFGAALGPYFVGVLSDAFIAGGVSGGAALRQALFVAMASSAVGIAMYIGAARCFEADVAIRDNRASQK